MTPTKDPPEPNFFDVIAKKPSTPAPRYFCSCAPCCYQQPKVALVFNISMDWWECPMCEEAWITNKSGKLEPI